ncbi:MAG: sigma-54-dependent Fis family transcriptional regulator [Desulfobacterales bacterium]|nr:sigma-54 dependent transcriptional regulator [Deltaproteobacteria bacterium]MBT8373533.1 sigma-54 dependent transcriptional regulator [Deltaproteobacteria bacterium]NNL42228.1 sigma-54-dependent Fis family transcriptional regulator [Desulfobacterales bacterium]NNL77162.1 sigma-54-dependent Fis family transcriptional regulator [Desulfobacterales bacterium]
MNSSIIVIDDDFDFLEIIKEKLTRIGFTNVRTEVDSIKVASHFERGDVYDIALIDMTMPDMDGIQLMELIKNTSPGTECIMVTAVNDARVAVDCLKKGAYDYLLKPIAREDLALSIHRALERKRLLDILAVKKKASLPKLIYADTFKPIITQSHKMLRILKEAELHATSDVPILITGESGTGKELLAKAIHCTSPRSKFKFTPVNMASVTAGLFEAEFFGHTKGAFTGAESGRAGFLEHTNQGTLFLDEIGNLPLELQGKLMRVLQDGEYMKLGSSSHRTADVRFITATNEDLDKLMAQGMFRKDLYYRIRCGWLHLPPLRDRKEDIPLLAKTFLQEYGTNSNNQYIDEEALCLLLEYDYPGNIRELKSIIQSVVNLAQGGPISPRLLPDHLKRKNAVSSCISTNPQETDAVTTLALVEKNHIITAYEQTGKNKSQTARLLGIGLNTLRRKLKSYGVD